MTAIWFQLDVEPSAPSPHRSRWALIAMHLCQTRPPNPLAFAGLNRSKCVLISCHLTTTHIYLFVMFLSPSFEARCVFFNSGCFAFRMNYWRPSLCVSRAPNGCIFGVTNLFGYCALFFIQTDEVAILELWGLSFTLFLFHIGHFGVFSGWVHDTFWGTLGMWFIYHLVRWNLSFTFLLFHLAQVWSSNVQMSNSWPRPRMTKRVSGSPRSGNVPASSSRP